MLGLVVDRDEALSGLIAACLARDGLRVQCTDGPVGAATALARQAYDYLIIDQATCSRDDWLRLTGGGHMPTLLLCTDPAKAWAGRTGDPVIQKPFSPPEFVMRTRLWLLEIGLAQPEAYRIPAAAEAFFLDIGAGSGQSTCALARQHGPGAVVVGLDRHFGAAVKAREDAAKLGFANLLWVVGDGACLPFSHGVFAAVSGVAYVQQDPQGAEAECHRVTRSPDQPT